MTVLYLLLGGQETRLGTIRNPSEKFEPCFQSATYLTLPNLFALLSECYKSQLENPRNKIVARDP